jgi:hypothetical protein
MITNTLRKLFYSLAGVTLLVSTAKSAVIPVDPRETYLWTEPTDTGALPSVAIRLSAHGFSAGDWVYMASVGSYWYTKPEWGGQEINNMVGVFSSTDEILPGDQYYRVPGAIGVNGVGAFTSILTWPNNLPKDIQEDFSIVNGITLQIPAGANYLFISTDDSFCGDNYAGVNGYGLFIEALASPVPESSTILYNALLVLLPFGTCAARRLRKK